ncbi:DNA-binding response regulator [Sphingomonas oleivorans]|uniref:DNA-binding response regulator n=1 Tax=Sphingomonas oleivorans TaxID=1735121 RepID=A0A2T5G265_9SPHN|nr:response regulator transcription factor [Sphingomonas oleivorans]PTQ13234.1 DNA-binding response regulator [Sphingomonas oleivorans]
MRALVVEDDPDVGSDLATALTAAGFVVDLTSEGNEAWFKGGVEDYAVAILDLGLPRLDGLTVLKRWRAEGRSFPVLILTARGEWTEKVEGIEAGADDYLAKPFAMGELIARVRGLVRRAAGRVSAVLTVGKLRLDTSRMTATIDGHPIRLSPLEFRFLDFLGHQPGRVVSAVEIAEHLYGAADGNDSNAIEALVVRLRRKIGPDIVETRRGFGYTLADATS